MKAHQNKVLLFFIPLFLVFSGLGVFSEARADKLSLNSASAEELSKLKGVTPGLAKAIVDYRATNGAFKKTEDLLKVPGMDKQVLDAIAPKLDQSGDIICPLGENSEQEEEPSLAPSKC